MMSTHINGRLFNTKVLLLFVFVSSVFLCFNVPATIAATQASFTWDSNPDPDVAGYRVFCREQNQPHDYTSPRWEGADTHSTVYGLDEGTPYCCVARALDIEGFESEDSNEICFDPSSQADQPPVPNEPPSAITGEDQTVDEGVVVTLDGSSSLDIDDGIASYQWTQAGTPAVMLSDSTSPTATFIAPDVGPAGVSLTFSLTVTDAGGLRSTDTCIVNISWLNDPPKAVVAPDYQETTGEILVTLDGSDSQDTDDGIASYQWTQIEGRHVSLSDATSSVASFTAPATESFDENIVVKLTVTDYGGLKDATESAIYVRQTDAPTLDSVVITGLTQVEEGSSAQYHLTAHYSDGNSAQVSGFAGWTENCDGARIDNLGYLTTDSVASDQLCTITARYEDQTDTHDVSIKSVSPNNLPMADFSYSTRKKKVSFNDLSNDSDGMIVSWQWDFGDGTYNITRNPVHRYTKFNDYSVTLTVTDNKGGSSSISKTIRITN